MAAKTWDLTTPADNALKNTMPGLTRDVKEHAFTASGFYTEQQSTPDQTVAIYSGIVFFGTTKVEYAGLDIVDLGTAGAFEVSALTADFYNKILFVIDSGGTLSTIEGTENAVLGSVVEPSMPSDKYPVCMISVQDDGTGTAGTISVIVQSSIQQSQKISVVENETQLVKNLKPEVNANVNLLDIFTKSGGADPDQSNPITIAVPDANGYTFRTRSAAYLSGTSQFIMADATDYWSKGDLASEIKTAWVYVIWDGTGIVLALAGYSGFNAVPTTTTVGDDDYFLLEASSTYTRSASHYCVAVAKIRYEYDTGDSPDHTFQDTVENAPQVIWNPKSDYGYQENLATTVTQGSDIAEYSAVSIVLKQSGKYSIKSKISYLCNGGSTSGRTLIKTGSATYGSAVQKSQSILDIITANNRASAVATAITYLNAGDTIHLGAAVSGASSNRILEGDSTGIGRSSILFNRID